MEVINAYEKIIEAMRKEGRYYNAPPLILGTVMSKGKIKIDEMILDAKKGDFLIGSSLRLDDEVKQYVHEKKPFGGEWLTDGAHNADLKEYKNNVLYPGDKVLMVKLTTINRNESEIFVVIAKVVKPDA